MTRKRLEKEQEKQEDKEFVEYWNERMKALVILMIF